MSALLTALLLSAAPGTTPSDEAGGAAQARTVRDFGDQGKTFDAAWGGFCTYWFCGAGPGGMLAWAVSSWVGNKRIPLLPMVGIPGAIGLTSLIAASCAGGAFAVPAWFFAVTGLTTKNDADRSDNLARAAAAMIAATGAFCCISGSGHLCYSIVGGVYAARGGRGTVLGENELEFDLWSVPPPTFYDEEEEERAAKPARPYNPADVLPQPSSLPAYVPAPPPVIIPPPANPHPREFHVLLNGRDISSLTSLTIDEASVAIDDKGNIFIEAGGFDPAAPSDVDVPGTRADVFLNGLPVDSVRSMSFPRCRVEIDVVGIHSDSLGISPRQ